VTGERIKVVHIITMLELGGAQEITLHQLSHLDPARYEPVLVAGTGGILDEAARQLPGVRVHFVPNLIRQVRPWRDFGALFDLRRILVEERPQVVHTHSSKAGILGRWAARLARVPVIVHSIHGFGFNDHQPWPVRRAFVMAERAAGRVTTGFTADAEDNFDKGRREQVLHGRPEQVIRCAIRPERFAPDPRGVARLRGELEIPDDHRVVGMVGCLKPQKAPVDFVRAAARVAEQCPETTFFIAGDGVLRPAVEAAVAEHGLGDRFRLLGWRDDVPLLLQLADVVALSSLWEGLPRVFPQAMACGRPIVANRVDGAHEAVLEGENGFLVEPGRPKLLAGGIIDVLRDDDLRRRMGQRALELVEPFTVGRMMIDLEAFYERLLACTIGTSGGTR
jgi:glycosyltransferase involved in cell wall biosynthesis